MTEQPRCQTCDDNPEHPHVCPDCGLIANEPEYELPDADSIIAELVATINGILCVRRDVALSDDDDARCTIHATRGLVHQLIAARDNAYHLRERQRLAVSPDHRQPATTIDTLCACDKCDRLHTGPGPCITGDCLGRATHRAYWVLIFGEAMKGGAA